MLGAIVGDITGSWYEGNGTKKYHFPLFMDPDRVTDDTVLTVAVADALTTGDGKPDIRLYTEKIRYWGNRHPRAGYGGRFKGWLADPSAGPYKSWGNGSAMRVSAVGWACDNEEAVLEQAALSAGPTHNHPEGIKGAQAVALAVFLARTGASKPDIRRQIEGRFGYDMGRSINTIRPSYRFEISCMMSVPEAIIAFLDSDDFESAIRNAISLGGDADTQAAIAGSVAEAFYGGIPEKFTAFCLPRIPMDLLEACIAFSERFMDKNTTGLLAREKLARNGENPDGIHFRQKRYTVLMSSETAKRTQAYSAAVNARKVRPGANLEKVISRWPRSRLNGSLVIQGLMETKIPCIFAEGQVSGDGSDWNGTELKILGDMSIAVPVTVYDNGLHSAPRHHDDPFKATLLYVPGALLAGGYGSSPADWDVVGSGGIDRDAYFRLYERRLLPGLKYASALAAARGKRVVVTVPGLGCGQFAGPFRGQLQVVFRDALEHILRSHSGELEGIAMVWYDPYRDCPAASMSIGSTEFRIRPLGHGGSPRPQLCRPVDYEEEGDDFSNCELCSVVAWDHVSWPGNDFWSGSRATDDGVKAAATDTMFRMTGMRGSYNPATHAYEPPEGFKRWAQVVSENGMTIRTWENTTVVDTRGKTPVS